MKNYTWLFIAALIIAGSAHSKDGANARDLYMTDSGVETPVSSEQAPAAKPKVKAKPKSKPKPKHTGIEVGVELLTPSGQSIMVSPDDYFFRARDQVRLHIKSNTEGYIYLVQMKSDGYAERLVPSQQGGMNNRVSREQEVVFPATTYFRFDANSRAEEVVYVYFLDGSDSLTAQLAMMPEIGTSTATLEMDAATKVTQQFNQSFEVASRDLVIGSGPVGNLQPASVATPNYQPNASFRVSNIPDSKKLATKIVLKRAN